jgi:uncharacterized membrane protein
VPHETNGATGLYDITRLTALSDGIFAIVLTLLVLDLKPPEPPLPGPGLADWLLGNGPDLVAWLVSFVVVARLWLVHHHVLDRPGGLRAGAAVANMAFLGAVSLVPFAASLVGSYEFGEPVAAVVFSAVLAVAGLLLGLVAHLTGGGPAWAARHHLLALPVIGLATCALSWFHPLAALVAWMVEAGVVVVAMAARR